MSERMLALFLRNLLDGRVEPAGAVQYGSALARLLESPAPVLQLLLGTHVDVLLSEWPDGYTLRPGCVPAITLWLGAVLNNIAWANTHSNSHLLPQTQRLVQAIPAASSEADALAYHSLLRFLDNMAPSKPWIPIVHLLLARSPLTSVWLPRSGEQLNWKEANWSLLLALLSHRPVRAALRDRLLLLLPAPRALGQGEIDVSTANVNQQIGQLLAGLLSHDIGLRPFVLEFYEADCERQRCGSNEQPVWPLLEYVSSARISSNPLARRNADRLLSRYRPLAAMLHDMVLLQTYERLDGRFLARIGTLLPQEVNSPRFQRVEGR